MGRGGELVEAERQDAMPTKGDMPQTDIAGAKASGIPTIWKRNGQPLPALPQADYTLDHLEETLSLPLLQAVAPSS